MIRLPQHLSRLNAHPFRLFLLTVLIGWHCNALAQPIVSVIANDDTASESGSTGQFTLHLNEAPPNNEALTVSYEVSGNATPNSDYEPLPGQIIFAAGETRQTLIVTPIADNVDEERETVVITLSENETYQVGTPAQAVVAILDDQLAAPLTVRLNALTQRISESAATPAQIDITLSQAANTDLTLTYRVEGSATAGEDFQSLPGTLTIPAGQQQATLEIAPIDDSLSEGDERIEVLLVPGSNYTLGSTDVSTTLIITDDEPAPDNGSEAPGAGGAAGIINAIRISVPATASINDSTRLTVTVVDGNDHPVAAVATQWQLTSSSLNAGATLSDADSFTNEDGEASITLQTGPNPAVYTLIVTATGNDGTGEAITLTQRVRVPAGLVDATTLSTPEGAIATAMDVFCPRYAALGSELNANEQALSARCTELLTALDADDSTGVNRALRRIAPEEVAAQRRLTERAGANHARHIAQRLLSLRHGSTGVNLSGLTLRSPDTALNGSLLGPLMSDLGVGGGAGDDGWQDQRLGIFISGTLGSGDKDLTASEAQLDFDMQQLTLGADYRYSPKWVAGSALSINTSETDLDAGGANLDTDGVGLSFYSSYYVNAETYFEGILSVSQHDYDSLRRIHYSLNGSAIARNAQATTSSSQWAISVGGGYSPQTNSPMSYELFGRLDYHDAAIDGYRESGAAEFNLNIRQQNYDALTAALGLRISYALNRRWGVLQPQAHFSWEHQSRGDHTISGTFAADRFDTLFQFATDEPDNNFFRSGVGLAAMLANGTSLFIQYETVIGRDRYSERELALGARWARDF